MARDREAEVQAAESAYNAARAVIQKCLPGKAGPGNESIYGQAYQRLVRLGMRPQIRGKYRG